ncbi:hypothetical protein BC828DRAFT_372829 [Blastocladiella britannica]|nr:hypothetical protein BC828DRAFT_372829 [Blastocladiella britannica]
MQRSGLPPSWRICQPSSCCGSLLDRAHVAIPTGRNRVLVASQASPWQPGMLTFWNGYTEFRPLLALISAGIMRTGMCQQQKATLTSSDGGREHGCLKALTLSIALESAKCRDLLLLKGWILDQPGLALAITELKDAENYPKFIGHASVSSLEWWWAHVAHGTELPEPPMFAQVVNECFCK